MAIFRLKKNKSGGEPSSVNKNGDGPIIISSDGGKKKYLIRSNNGRTSSTRGNSDESKREGDSCLVMTKTKSIIAINAQLALYHDLKRKISVLEGIFMNTYGPAILTKSEIGFREMLILRAKLRNQLSKYRDKFFADNGRVPQTDKDLSPIKDVVSEYLQLREIIRVNAATKIQAVVRAVRARQTTNGRQIYSMVKERKRKEIMAGIPKSPNTRQMPRAQPNYHFSRNTNRMQMQTIMEEDDNDAMSTHDEESVDENERDGETALEGNGESNRHFSNNRTGSEEESLKLQKDFKLQKVESGNIHEMLNTVQSGRIQVQSDLPVNSDSIEHEARDDDTSVSSQQVFNPDTMEVVKDLMHSDQMNILQGAYNKRMALADDDVSIYSMNRDDMTEEELKTIKFKLKSELKKFDADFMIKNGRKPTRSERQPTFHLFLAYIKVKSRLKALSVHREVDDCRTVASDCSSVLTMEADVSNATPSTISLGRNKSQKYTEMIGLANTAQSPRPPAYPKSEAPKKVPPPSRGDQMWDDKGSKIDAPQGSQQSYSGSSVSSESERPTFEVRTTAELMTQKSDYNRRLKKYDLDFVKANGRKPTWSESKPIHKIYQDYVRVKAQLDMRLRSRRSLMDDD